MDPSTPEDTAVAPNAGATRPARRRFGRLRAAAMALAVLLLVYLLLSWFAFEPLLRWALPRYAQQHGEHQLSFQAARFDPWRLAVDVQGLDLRRKDGEPLLQLGRLELDFDAASPFRRAWTFERVAFTEPVVHLALQADGRPNWMDLLDSLAGPPAPAEEPPAEPTRWLMRHLIVQRGQLDLADRSQGRDVQLRVTPLDLEVQGLSTLPGDRGQYRLRASLADGAALSWNGQLGLNPTAASGELMLDGLPLERLWPYLSPWLTMAPPQGKGALRVAYQLKDTGSRLALVLDPVEARFEGLALRGEAGAEPAIALDRLSMSGGKLDLATREVSIASVDIGPGRIALARDGNGRLDLEGWLRPASAPPTEAAASAATPGAEERPWRLAVGQVRGQALALQLSDQSFTTALRAQAAQLQFGFALRADIGSGVPGVQIEKLGLNLDGVQLTSAGQTQPWFELDRIELTEGQFSAAGHEAALGAVTLTGGRLRAERDAQGQLSLVQALQPRASAARPAPAASAPSASPVWRYRIGRVQAREFALSLREASVTPPTEIDVFDLQAEAQGLSEDLRQALPVTLDFRVRSGGHFKAQGQVVPALPSVDLKIALDSLSLAPAQAYVAQATTLVLDSGVAGTSGRLRWQPDSWRYEGALDLGPLLVNEGVSGERFLSWKRLSSTDLAVTPDGLRIGELKADGLGAKLTIFKDKTLNAAKIMKPVPASERSPVAAPTATKPFGIDVGRVRIAGGTLDFADLSLALPFGTRIHDLSGQLVGLTRSGNTPAQLALDGKVDEFGLARAAGQLLLFDPTASTDVKVEFRNVEMTTLTPYSATFAGRRIASGKLSLDLEYRIQQRQLAGDNKIVMDRLTLGERVDSPDAADLPLDLALAVLQDADGRIDLGLPISGSLDDPTFSYGQIVWKAIVNVLTKIVTAPFRALGALLGGGEQTLDRIGFDVGRATLLPPEREKLKTLSEALARRPRLALTVQPGYDPEADAGALRLLAVRRAVASQSGRALAPDEDPGPISTAQPDTQAALEQLFTKRFGADALTALRKALPQGQPASAPASGAPAVGLDLHALLLRRLVDAQAVDETLLRALAMGRGQAIQAELAARAVPAARIQVEPPAALSASGKTVQVTLGVAVSAPPAGSAAAPAAPGSAAAR